MATTLRDPKTIVTPDAFSVHPSLLGTPLASPSRRGVALLIDLFLVILITTLTSGFWFILGVVAAAFFFTRAKKEGKNDRRSNLLRFSLGCMGVMALSVTGVVFFGIRYMNQSSEDFGSFFSTEGETPGAFVVGASPGSAPDRMRTLFGGLQEGAQLASTDDPEEAVALAVSIGRRFQELEPDGDVVDLLEDLIPETVGRVDGREILERALVQLSSAPQDDGAGALRRELLDTRADLEEARADLDEAVQRRGLIGWLTSRIDSLGFGFGWWTLYFAILMPWMKGQTPGKRVMGVRVVRLDAKPVTGWHAFERAGGYAAGVATGTLGFLQIYWDANRQAIHDKVAGTVVIREGFPKVPGSWDRQVTGNPTQPGEAGPA